MGRGSWHLLLGAHERWLHPTPHHFDPNLMLNAHYVCAVDHPLRYRSRGVCRPLWFVNHNGPCSAGLIGVGCNVDHLHHDSPRWGADAA